MSPLFRLPLIASTILVAVTTSATAGPNLLINGSFEDATNFVDQVAGTMVLPFGSTTMPGWTVTSMSPISWIGPAFPLGLSAEDGSYFVDLLGGGRLRQNIVTIPGDQYRLSFYLGSSSISILNAMITAVVAPEPVALPGQVVSQTFTSTLTGVNNWELESLDFVAFTASTVVAFTGDDRGYIGLDNVSVVATGAATVPEPASLTLLAGGFAFLGLARARFLRGRINADPGGSGLVG